MMTKDSALRTILFYYDEPFETTESYYLEVIRRVTDGIHFYAGILAKDQIGETGGFPDLLNVATPEQKESLERLTRGISEIDDPTLQQLLLSLEEQVNRLWELEDRLIDIVTSFLQVQRPRSKVERRRLQRRINRMWHKPDHLSWKGQPEYQKLAGQSVEAWSVVGKVKPLIDNRVAYLEALVEGSQEKSNEARSVPTSNAPSDRLIRPRGWITPQLQERLPSARTVSDFDQRVEDIINESIEETDPREAIKRLRYALRIDPSGALVSLVYAHLAMKHKELENLGWAIRYYSKAVAATTQPWPIIHFWRGQLYFQKRRWHEARRDLQEALKIPGEEGGILSPEYEQALEYLEKLDQLTEGK